VPDGLEGVTFHQVYRSASEIARVGGDFYDLIELGPGRIGVLIGDVSGKGIEASVMTSLVRNTVRAYALDGFSAGEAVARTNRAVFSASPKDVFVTLFFGVVDVSHATLEYCNAGHPAPILLDPSSEPLQLDPTAAIVGAYGEAPYGCSSCPIAPGSTLLLFTDGLTEARRKGDLFGEERVLSIVRGKRWDSPRELVEAVMRETLSFSGGELIDDIAVVALRLEPDAYDSIPRQVHLPL
jgi:sigma-B regulation protein RsbU (phosphoserine phosphatase)